MGERDELVQVVAEALVSALGPDDGTYTCDCTTERCPATPCPTAVTVRDAAATAVVEALGERLAAAWDEGARAAWERSGEGWNGEYPDDAEPWEPDASPNPYRTDPKEHDR